MTETPNNEIRYAKATTQLRIQRLSHCYQIPTRATEGSAGYDLYAAIGTNTSGLHYPHETHYKEISTIIKANWWTLIPTGIKIEIPPGFEGQVRSRSGLALKNGISVLNSPGTIDSDYRGEISVVLMNHSHSNYTVHRGDRIAQLVFARCYVFNLVPINANEKLEDTTRGEGGFGSTGTGDLT